jgi:hypothetical protein
MRNGPSTDLTGTASQFAVYAAHGGRAARPRGALSFDPNTCGDIENAPRATQHMLCLHGNSTGLFAMQLPQGRRVSR